MLIHRDAGEGNMDKVEELDNSSLLKQSRYVIRRSNVAFDIPNNELSDSTLGLARM